MSDDLALFRLVTAVLEEMAIPYMIGGSVALAVWAAPRTTHDLDLVVDMAADRIVEFCSHFTAPRFFIDPADMSTAFGHRDTPSMGMYSFLDTESGFKVDLFPFNPADSVQQSALNRRVKVDLLEGLSATVYAPDDLLVQKLRWYAASGSERQFRDCLNLLLTDFLRAKPLINNEYVTTLVG